MLFERVWSASGSCGHHSSQPLDHRPHDGATWLPAAGPPTTRWSHAVCFNNKHRPYIPKPRIYRVISLVLFASTIIIIIFLWSCYELCLLYKRQSGTEASWISPYSITDWDLNIMNIPLFDPRLGLEYHEYPPIRSPIGTWISWISPYSITDWDLNITDRYSWGDILISMPPVLFSSSTPQTVFIY